MSEFTDAIERYKQEMMRIAGSQPPSPSPAPAPTPVPPPPRPEPVMPQPEPEQRPEPITPPMAPPVPPVVLPPMDDPGENIVMEDTGFLQVKTFTALEALPVSGAVVVVSRRMGDEREFVRMLNTDLSGATDTIALPTVARSLSESPGYKTPFSTYDIEVTKQGFVPIFSRDIPIFSQVKTVQNFELIALPEFDDRTQQTVIENTEPTL